MRIMKKMLAGLLAAAVAVSCVVPAYASETSPDAGTTKNPVAQETTVEKNGMTANVVTDATGQASMTEVKSSKKTVTVSPKVTIDGVSYTVTTIEANAFKGCKKAKTIELPKTIKTIAKNAFKGLKNKSPKVVLKGLTKAKDITAKKGAFNGLSKKAKIVVSKKTTKKQLKKITKKLEKAGFKGTVVKKK